MAGWEVHEGKAVHLPQDNVDTDQVIPARFMSTPRSRGYRDFLMHDLRRGDDGALLPDFPLNAEPGASILIAGRNFGSGSSREAAVYALVDAGFRAVVAPGFGDIFAANAVNNGLLPATLPEEDIARLVPHIDRAAVRVDLAAGAISANGVRVDFRLDEMWRTKLLRGWDDIDLTLQHADAIASYREGRFGLAWALPMRNPK